MYFWDRGRWVHDLGEEVLEEACIRSAYDAFVMGGELYVCDIFTVRARYGDGGG